MEVVASNRHSLLETLEPRYFASASWSDLDSGALSTIGPAAVLVDAVTVQYSATRAHDTTIQSAPAAKTVESSTPTPARSDLTGMPAIAGDANLDGRVDARDAAILKQSYGMKNASWTDGDFNHDHKVDSRDFNLIGSHLLVSHIGSQPNLPGSEPAPIGPVQLLK